MKTASWIIRNKATKEVVGEYWVDLSALPGFKSDKYEAVPILEYLQELNREIKGK